jgi:hypothetical protein
MLTEVAGVIFTGVIKVVGGALLAVAGVLVMIYFSQLPERWTEIIGSILNPFGSRRWKVAYARLMLGIVSVIILGGGTLLCAVGVAELLGHNL